MIRIDAPPERVWEFFPQPEAMTRWMGEYAVLAPRPGGEFTVNIQGVPVRRRYLSPRPARQRARYGTSTGPPVAGGPVAGECRSREAKR